MPGALEAVAWRAWAPRTAGERILRAALVPAAVAYGAVASARNRLYDAGWLATRRVPARVLSVGNLTVGGTGKTPTALWLAERLVARGLRTGVVARGYGRQTRGVVVVGEDGSPLVDAEAGGDEAVLLSRRFAGPVVVGERRADAAALAQARFALDAIVLDDGFQHRALARDADLVLATADDARDWPLPAGRLREPARGLRRARALLAIDGTPPTSAGIPQFRGRLQPTGVVRVGPDGGWTAEPLDTLSGTDVTAVAGIARPERFLGTLAAIGARVREVLRFPDHHRYTADDARRIAAAGGPVVTTEKDLVKLARFPGLLSAAAVRVALEIEEGDALVDMLLAPGPPVELRPD